MRKGMLMAWRQRSDSTILSSWDDLSAKALVGFLTLLLSISLVSVMAMTRDDNPFDSIQSLATEAFNLGFVDQRSLESTESSSVSALIMGLEGIEDVRVERSDELLKIWIENDRLFFSGTADIKEASEGRWEKLIAELNDLGQPLNLAYHWQSQPGGPLGSNRSILTEQAAIIVRLFAAENLWVRQFDFVETWVAPGIGQSTGIDQNTETMADSVSEPVFLTVTIELATE